MALALVGGKGYDWDFRDGGERDGLNCSAFLGCETSDFFSTLDVIEDLEDSRVLPTFLFAP